MTSGPVSIFYFIPKFKADEKSEVLLEKGTGRISSFLGGRRKDTAPADLTSITTSVYSREASRRGLAC